MRFTITYTKEDYIQGEKLYLQSIVKWWQTWLVQYINFRLLFSSIMGWLKVNPYVPVEFEISAEGVTSNSPKAGKKKWLWNDFTNYALNQNYLILYHNPNQKALIIFPKQQLTEEVWNELVGEIKKHIKLS